MSCPVAGASSSCGKPASNRTVALVAVGVAAIAGIAYYYFFRKKPCCEGEVFDGCCDQPMKLKKRKRVRIKRRRSSSASTDGSVLSMPPPSPGAVAAVKKSRSPSATTSEKSAKENAKKII